MSFITFIKNHIDDINNYVQPSIHWREGRFANPVEKAESTNGDFAEVVRNLPDELSREDVVNCFREDPYNGFVATILWGGISRYCPEEIARRNNRASSIPKLERLRATLQGQQNDLFKITEAIGSLFRGRNNHFYGIGPSFYTKLLYFLAYDISLETRPIIYDENLKPVHFALMPECGQNPFDYYHPIGGELNFAFQIDFNDVYVPYCQLMCNMARELEVDVTNLESWVFGWPANSNLQQPNPRVVARTEVDRMAQTDILKYNFGIGDLDDAIGASRIFYDNKIDVPESLYSEEGALHIGNDEEHPIVITETDEYVHLEYVITEILFQLKNLESKMISQHCISVGNKKLDWLCFEVKSAKNKKPKEMDVYFDITAGYNALSS